MLLFFGTGIISSTVAKSHRNVGPPNRFTAHAEGKEMRSVSQHMLVSLAALTFAAAAGAQNPGNAKRNSNVILREELQGAQAANAYELVQSFRPQWFRERGHETIRTQQVERPNGRGRIEVATTSAEPDILVYINDSRFGDVDALRDIPATGLGSLEFISPTKATLRWGSGHTNGVIVVHPATGTFP